MKIFVVSLLLLGFSLGTPCLMAQEDKASDSAKVEHFSHESKKLGKTYYLFSKDVTLKSTGKVQRIYYFAKDPKNKKGKPVAVLPEGKMVSETKNGLPVLKNKTPKKK